MMPKEFGRFGMHPHRERSDAPDSSSDKHINRLARAVGDLKELREQFYPKVLKLGERADDLSPEEVVEALEEAIEKYEQPDKDGVAGSIRYLREKGPTLIHAIAEGKAARDASDIWKQKYPESSGGEIAPEEY